MVDPILSPKARIAGPAGPIHLMGGVVFCDVSGRRGFSEACPHPVNVELARLHGVFKRSMSHWHSCDCSIHRGHQ
jgi:hypothetical protein